MSLIWKGDFAGLPGKVVLANPMVCANTAKGDNKLYSDAKGVVPSLDLRFASQKNLNDYMTGQQLIQFSRPVGANQSPGTYVDENGIIQLSSADQPRFDHDPTTGESLGLLVEVSRTNILLNSATLSTQSVTTSATAYTLSFYGTGTITLSGTSTAGPLTGTGANDRVTLTFTPTAGTLTLTVTGTVSNAQLETGSFPTSYIPTTGTALTRSADVASITGTKFSSWYSQSEGTVFADAFNRVIYDGTNIFPYILQFDDGSNAERISFDHSALSLGYRGFFVVRDNNVDSAAVTAIYPASSGFLKMAGAYALNSFAASANGNPANTDNSGTLPTVNRLQIGKGLGQQYVGTISRLTYFPDRLPDTTLQAITAT
jgi:hypothetical protein